MAKKKTHTAGVRNYQTDTKKSLKVEKKELLKRMAQVGNEDLGYVADEIAAADSRTYDRQADNYDRGAAVGAPDSTLQEIDKGRKRLLGGYDAARGQQGTAHSEELDRITAANIAYMDQLGSASKLNKQRMDKQILALQLAQSGVGGRGGGGGGRTGGGDPLDSEDGLLDTELAGGDLLASINDDLIERMTFRGVDDNNQARILGNINNNAELTASVDQAFAEAYANGLSYDAVANGLKQSLIQSGYDPVLAGDIVRGVGQAYADNAGNGNYNQVQVGTDGSTFKPSANAGSHEAERRAAAARARAARVKAIPVKPDPRVGPR